MTITKTKIVDEFPIKSLSGYQVSDSDEIDHGASHEDVESIALKLNEIIQIINSYDNH